MADIQMEYGPRYGADTVTETPWMGKGACMVTQDVWGKYFEAARRGLMFSASTALTGASAIAAANVSPLTAGTGQPILGLYVPVGSSFDVSLISIRMWSISGTPGPGAFGWNIIPNSFITATGTRGVSHATGAASSDSTLFSNVATTGSAAGILLRGIGPSDFAAALAASAGPLYVEDVVDGAIYLSPGMAGGIAAPAAGTTWVVGASLTWIEIPRTVG